MRNQGWIPLADLLQELRFSLRRLRTSVGVSAVALLTLAVGIGATTVIFSVLNGVLLRPLPFDEPDRLVAVSNTAAGWGAETLAQSQGLHLTYLDESEVFDELGLWSTDQVSILGQAEPELAAAIKVTDGTLRALGVQPSLGRRFTPEDDTAGAPETALLSHRYWQNRFGGDQGVIGESLRIDGRTLEVIGVMPQGFRFLDNDPAVYLPFQIDRSEVALNTFGYRSLGRLKPGMTIDRATRELAALLPVAAEKFPGGMTLENLEEARMAPVLRPLKAEVVGDVGDVLWVLVGTAGIILLIACANVANLFLVRAEARDRDLAVRAALGASHGRVFVQFLSESVVLAVAGGFCGLGLAYGGLHLVKTMAPANLPRISEISLDATVLVFTLGVSVLSGLFFGLFPVLRFGRIDLLGALREGGRGSSSGRERHRVRNALVVAQIALALVLLVGSGLLVRSIQALGNVDPGFRSPQEALTFWLTIPDAEIEDPEAVARAHELIAKRLAEIPGVESVSLSTSVTMDDEGSFDAIFVEDQPVAEGQMPPVRRQKWIGAGYFETMQNPLLAGRAITWADIHDRTRVLVVTENFAREYWRNPHEAIGKRIGTGLEPGDWREIVGVVGNVQDDGLRQAATAVVYWPMVVENFWGKELFVPRSMVYILRSPRVGTAALLREVQQGVWSVNANLPLASVRTMEDILAGSMARISFSLVMLGIAAAVALLLGMVGIYGVISYVVSQRMREIGVRMAFGAAARDISHLILGQGLRLAIVGVAVGLVSAFGLTRWMSALLYGVSPVDPVTFATVAVGLVGVVLSASYLPTRRAGGMNPTDVLRAE